MDFFVVNNHLLSISQPLSFIIVKLREFAVSNLEEVPSEVPEVHKTL
jgi:hypothetical protein